MIPPDSMLVLTVNMNNPVGHLVQVLAFDSFDRRLRSVLVEVFQKHGIPLQETTGSGRPPVQVLAPQLRVSRR